MSPRRSLIVCASHSCRSEPAGARAHHAFAGQWEATAAGTRTAWFVGPLTLQALAGVGIAHAGAPGAWGASRDQVFEPVLTASDWANGEWLALPGADNRVYRSLPDPAEALHEQAQRLQFYRKGRDDLRRYRVTSS